MHGDARFYNNLFIQGEKREDLIAVTDKIGNHKLSEYQFTCGTKPYDGYPTPEEYFAMFTAENCNETFGLDGREIIFNEDYFGNHRNLTALPGPFKEKPEEALI